MLAFSGCVLVVSHDRYFLNRVCTGIIAFEGDGQVVYNEGDYEYYQGETGREKRAPGQTGRTGQGQGQAGHREYSQAAQTDLEEKKELEGMEEAILVAEEEVSRIEGLFADPEFHSKHGNKTSELTLKWIRQKTRQPSYTPAGRNWRLFGRTPVSERRYLPRQQGQPVWVPPRGRSTKPATPSTPCRHET